MVKHDTQGRGGSHKLTIYINGMRYPIKTQEDPAYVAELAREIDESTKKLVAAGSTAGEAMVLLCLSYIDNWKKAEQSADNLRDQVTKYLDDAAKARSELAEANRELEKLRRLREGGAK